MVNNIFAALNYADRGFTAQSSALLQRIYFTELLELQTLFERSPAKISKGCKTFRMKASGKDMTLLKKD